MNIRKRLAHEVTQNGEMLPVRVPTESQLADVFTKGLHYQHWQACVEGILSKTFKPSLGTSDLKRGFSGDRHGSQVESRLPLRGVLQHYLGMPRFELDIDFYPAEVSLMTRMGSG
jgi:hypothetical protein